MGRTSYAYANGSFDTPDREFRGFGVVTETRPDSSSVTHFFHQDDAKKGKEYRAIMLSLVGDETPGQGFEP